MPWCLECNIEYREGFTKCAHCGGDLQEKPPETELYIRKDKPMYAFPRTLITLPGSIEADRVRSVLESAGIQVACVYPGAGQYLRVATGVYNGDVALMVPEEQLEQSQAVLEQLGLTENGTALPELAELPDQEIPPDELEQMEKGSRGKRVYRTYLRIALILFALWVVAAVIVYAGALYNVFRGMLS